MGQALLGCPGQYALLDLRGGLGIERGDGVGEFPRVQVGELTAPQQVQGGRQPLDQGPRNGEAAFRGARGEPQRGADPVRGCRR